MPRDGSGRYIIPPSSWYPPQTGNDATPDDFKALIDDLAGALSQSMSADGQTPMSVHWNFQGYRISGVGEPRSGSDAINRDFISKGDSIPLSAVIQLPRGGSMFRIVGSGTIEGISSSFEGRQVWLTFDSGVTLKDSQTFIMPEGKDVEIGSSTTALFAEVESGVWKVMVPRMGTAASRDVGTGPGNVMEVGTGGLAVDSPQSTNDVNSATKNGFYKVDANAAGAPETSLGALIVYGQKPTSTTQGSGYLSQLFSTSASRTEYVRRATRVDATGTPDWGSWKPVHVGNVTVSDDPPSGGVDGDIWIEI